MNSPGFLVDGSINSCAKLRVVAQKLGNRNEENRNLRSMKSFQKFQ